MAQCADHILISLDGRKPLDLDRAQARVLTGQKRQKVYGYGLSVVLQQWLRSGGAESACPLLVAGDCPLAKRLW